MTKQLISTVAIAAIVGLTGCGSGSSSNEAVSSMTKGQFLDSAVKGLTYKCSSGATGMTDAFGNFTCNTGDNVEFSINDFVLGSTLAAKFITPKALFPNSAIAQVNLAQLLQTLDSDGNPNNGITIDKTSKEVQSLSGITEISFSQVDFDSLIASYIGKVLVDEKTANSHLELTTKNLENDSGNLNNQSIVVILNNVTETICQANNPYKHSYEGYSDFANFLNAGGSTSLNYFSSPKSCSEYSTSGYCTVQDYADIGFDVSGTGSCVQVVTFPSVSGEVPETNTTDTIIPPVLLSTYNNDTRVKYMGNDSYLRVDKGILYLTNATKQNNVWQYQPVEGAREISVIKIAVDKIIIKTLAWDGKTFVKFISKADGSELRSIVLDSLGSVSMNADDSIIIQANGLNRKLISLDGNIILDIDNITSNVSNEKTIVFNDEYTTKTLKAYDFNANLLWESNTTCQNMIVDSNAVYCEQVSVDVQNLTSNSTFVKVSITDGEIMSEATFESFGKLYQNGTSIFTDINGWDKNGYATYSFISIDKGSLEKKWSVINQNIAGVDTVKELVYTNMSNDSLNAYNMTDGNLFFNMEFKNYSSFSVNGDSSIIAESYTGSGYEYRLYQY
jgi:hypothetical protein